MKIILIRAISWFSDLLTLLLCIRAILSWFARDPYSPVGKAYYAMVRITEPIVSPCRELLRRLNANTGMLDFSLLLAFFMVRIVARLLAMLVYIIF
ncbi:MAG: YggT family protein [Eubacteriaceae bacterium]|nr:YggT family protein [Eubacteriaceae bacterium]